MLLPRILYSLPAPQALEPADAVLDGMDCSGENMAGLLDGLIQPVLSALGSGAGQTAALSLMCTLCEQRPELKVRGVAAPDAAEFHAVSGGESVVTPCSGLPAGGL